MYVQLLALVISEGCGEGSSLACPHLCLCDRYVRRVVGVLDVWWVC